MGMGDGNLFYRNLQQMAHEDGHFESLERWYGQKAGANSVNAIDINSLTPFTMTSGNNVFGPAIPIVGSADTPILAGAVGFHHRRILSTSPSSNSPYKIRVAWGATWAAGVAAGDFVEWVVSSSKTDMITDIIMPMLPSGTIVWAACWNATNLATLGKLVGLHEHTVMERFPGGP